MLLDCTMHAVHGSASPSNFSTTMISALHRRPKTVMLHGLFNSVF